MKLRYRIKNIKDYIKYDIPYGIKNLIKWFPLVWKDRDYDHNYILYTLKFKIHNTRKLHEKNRRHVGVEKEIHCMKVCEILLDRLIKDDYYLMHYNKTGINNKKTIIRINNSIIGDKEYLFHILSKRIDSWWD